MAKLGFGIIGLGMALAPHARSFQDLADRVTVRGAYSPSAERRRRFSAQYGLAAVDSVEALLDDPEIRCVSVLTPPHTHLELVRRCAAAGKHILLEKPLEIDLARAHEVVATCERAGVVLGVCLQHRYRPSAVRLAALMREGSLGAIANAGAVMRLWRPQSYYDVPGRGTRARDGGGVLLTQGIHTLDLLLEFAGAPAEVAAYAVTTPVHRMETEDCVATAVRYASGAIGTIDATTAAYPGAPERIELVCGSASVSLVGTGLEVRWHDGREELLAAQSGLAGAGANPMDFPHEWHRALITDFCDAVESGGTPQVGGPEALRVQSFIAAMLESAARGGAPVKVPAD
ncbi:MAG: Gfo/Idh/MocA family oxidoreductase [Burkholderiales bacterium]